MNAKIRQIRIEGNDAYVPLSNGREAIIDVDDICLVTGITWWASVRNGICYAICGISKSPRRFAYMHRVIAASGSSLHVDHINGNGLDNRRPNLRLATVSENLRNQRRSSANSSGFKGVSWHNQCKKWRATIKLHGVSKHLGLFCTAEEAYDAYCEASESMHGVWGRVT